MAREAALVRDAWTCVVCRRGPGAERIIASLLTFALWSPALVDRDELVDRFLAWSDARLEVNHIDPRRGQGYLAGCHHHQANLETLCRPHHVAVTRAQRDGFARSARLLIGDASPALPLPGMLV